MLFLVFGIMYSAAIIQLRHDTWMDVISHGFYCTRRTFYGITYRLHAIKRSAKELKSIKRLTISPLLPLSCCRCSAFGILVTGMAARSLMELAIVELRTNERTNPYLRTSWRLLLWWRTTVPEFSESFLLHSDLEPVKLLAAITESRRPRWHLHKTLIRGAALLHASSRHRPWMDGWMDVVTQL